MGVAHERIINMEILYSITRFIIINIVLLYSLVLIYQIGLKIFENFYFLFYKLHGKKSRKIAMLESVALYLFFVYCWLTFIDIDMNIHIK